ncbi:Oxygen-independent coproporphyrinogen-III oxidase-like protein HemZ [bioreactor metagenome]|uniref:Oxygen-independent coproporphyrinogen-III oxidase-like protein HemZ n=1 Tax=bioreactor metagenome TaxID=1076179 RepID=A0A644WMW4_9ZZZZ
MKLYFRGHEYKYAVEQSMLTLFPGERPEYPQTPPEPGDNTARLTLSFGKRWATAAAEITWMGETRRRACRTSLSGLAGKVETDRALQHIIKLSFYRAATGLLGREPPWGALSGVRPVKLPTRAMELGATEKEAEDMLRRDYRVSPLRRELAMDCARAALNAKRALAPNHVSLYVGIPFCPTRCAYCSFISADVTRALGLVEPYLEVLYSEINASGAALRRAGRLVRTVYIGGGTPTTLSAEQLRTLMGRIAAAFDLSECVEFTVEAGRPDTITAEKLAAIRMGGGNRISVNPQSMEDTVLEAIGRAHKAAEIADACALVRRSGIPIMNMDLIAGLPKDTPETFRASLDKILALKPENITVHTLALKKGSRLMEQKDALPEGGDVARMLDYAWGTLRAGGYSPYYLYRQKFMSGSFENVGWCLEQTESLYNICMMEELHSILSLGAGGVTKLVWEDGRQIFRHANPKYPQEYIRSISHIIEGKENLVWPIS